MAAACHSHTTHSLLSWVELDQPWMETLVLPTVLPTVGAYWLTNPLKSAKTISYCGLDWEWELHPRPGQESEVYVWDQHLSQGQREAKAYLGDLAELLYGMGWSEFLGRSQRFIRFPLQWQQWPQWPDLWLWWWSGYPTDLSHAMPICPYVYDVL